MPVEIERKFLVRSNTWRSAATGSLKLLDGLLARFGDGKVRVRIADDRAWLTAKGPRRGLSRSEFEYEIAYAEAEAMLHTLCDGPLIEKTRYLVPHDGLIWEVDVHEGALQSLTLAEIELEYEDQAFTRLNGSGGRSRATHAKRRRTCTISKPRPNRPGDRVRPQCHVRACAAWSKGSLSRTFTRRKLSPPTAPRRATPACASPSVPAAGRRPFQIVDLIRNFDDLGPIRKRGGMLGRQASVCASVF
ncbi:CYTH domain-containing protein [Microvirga sp. VF16]|uniref:CYTH domain-containing protein n=1 Tax=Microvirga sp. VF16 TaxID=2807101 RepID=UPI00353005FC